MQPNKACTGRLGFVPIFELFCGFGSFPFSNFSLPSRQYRLLHLSSAERNPFLISFTGAKIKSAWRTTVSLGRFYFGYHSFFLLQGSLRHPRQPKFRAGVLQSFVCRPRQPLGDQTKFSHPHQDFFPGRQSPGNIPAHKARNILLYTQLHQCIFGELLVGQSHANLFVQAP